LLAPLPALAQVSQSATVAASLEVPQSLIVSAGWVSGGGSTVDFGQVAPNTTASDQISLNVYHNLASTQTFSVQASVTKTSGPTWEQTVSMNDGSEYLIWDQGSFGTTQTYTDPIGGSGNTFNKVFNAFFNVGLTQAPSSYSFEVAFTVTSL
jgi:hypothetical protein